MLFCNSARANANGRSSTVNERPKRSGKRSWWYLLFLVQFIAVLWVPFYNSATPYWAGIPFFYWYQMAWVILGAISTVIVYLATEK
jgi:Protein of unknown function (DUF3311)